MSNHTRFIRLSPASERSDGRNGRTVFGWAHATEPVKLVDHRGLFNHHQRRLHQILSEYPRPGVAVFAVHGRDGMAGHLWLEASERLRAGTIGRHSRVDLFLPGDGELSLRHLLVLVRRARIQVLDLATPAGFQAEQGGVLRGVDASGPFVLRAASYSLFLFPTGAPPPWDRHAADPWSTLPPRLVSSSERSPRRPSSGPRADPGQTAVGVREGPCEAGPLPALEPGETAAGLLLIENGGAQECVAVGSRALERGLILGRYARCTGDTGVTTNDVSRVHAVLIEQDGEVHLVDAGSSNGVSRDGGPVKCEAIAPARTYHLGSMRVSWEPAH